MPVVDDYIKAHLTWPVSRIAEGLGLGREFVASLIRKKGYVRLKPNSCDGNLLEEIKALLHLIEERKSGWAVEIAKERIKFLETNTQSLV